MIVMGAVPVWHVRLTRQGVLCAVMIFRKYPEQTVDIVKEWSAKHTKETRLTRLLKNYPNTPLLNKDGIPVYVCAAHLGLMDIEDCDNDCIICWNTALEEE